MKELEKLQEIFNADTEMDEETREDNQKAIDEWAAQLVAFDDYEGWKNHPVTQSILKRAKETYVDSGVAIMNGRGFSNEARQALWAKQDAMLWFISIASRNVDLERKEVESRIRAVLDSIS